MIYVDRPTTDSSALFESERRESERKRLFELLKNASETHLAQLRVSFDESLWLSYKRPLATLFQNKCAYCESDLNDGSGLVEHYRPRQSGGRPEASRGHLYYAWLAYDWENLLLACAACNARRGSLPLGSDFLANAQPARFLADVMECRSVEVPLLLDPCFDDPAAHLDFTESGLVTALSTRGEESIRVLGLNERPELVSARHVAWKETARGIEDLLSNHVRGSPWTAAMELTVRQLTSTKQPYVAPRRGAVLSWASGMASRGWQGADASGWSRPRRQQTGTSGNRSLDSAPVLPQTRWGKFPGKEMLPESAAFRIEHLSIRNFKAIASIDIDFPAGTGGLDGLAGSLALIGENATGKSSILEAIALTLLGTEQVKRLGLNLVDFLHREADGSGLSNAAEVQVRLSSRETVHMRIDGHGQMSGTSEASMVLLGFGPRRFFATNKNVKRFSAPWHRVRSMFDPLATLPNPTRWLLSCSQRQFDLAVRALRAMLLLPDESIVTRQQGADNTAPAVLFEMNGRPTSIESLSEGYKTVIAMSVDVMREMLRYWPDLETARGVVLVDELDTHLHPRWKMRIARRLRLAMPKVQFLSSTHDPLCLRGFRSGEVVVLRRDSEGSIERVLGLPNVQGLSVEQLLTSEYFGLYSSEDPAMDEDVARYATLLGSRSRNTEEEEELVRQRDAIGGTLLLGSSPREQIAQAALEEYLLSRRGATGERVRQLRRTAIDRAKAIWDDVGPTDDDERAAT